MGLVIEFTAHIGDEVFDIELSEPNNGGGNCYHIYVFEEGNRCNGKIYYCGQICKMNDGWNGYPNAKSGLTWADMLIAIEMIEKVKNERRD